MIEVDAKVSEIILRTPSVRSIRFKTKEDFEFEAGQFFFLTIIDSGIDSPKPFSFSNSPTEEGYIEFTKRLTESPFSKALEKLKVGDKAKIKLPYGSFTLKQDEKKLAFISGGIGITPIRSICKYATDKKLLLDIVLFYGNSTEKDIIFKNDFDHMHKEKTVKVIYTLTEQDQTEKAWQGRTGFINEQMIIEEMPDYKQRTFSICGPVCMVEDIQDMLKTKLGIDERRIIKEKFSGYKDVYSLLSP